MFSFVPLLLFDLDPQTSIVALPLTDIKKKKKKNKKKKKKKNIET